MSGVATPSVAAARVPEVAPPWGERALAGLAAELRGLDLLFAGLAAVALGPLPVDPQAAPLPL